MQGEKSVQNFPLNLVGTQRTQLLLKSHGYEIRSGLNWCGLIGLGLWLVRQPFSDILIVPLMLY